MKLETAQSLTFDQVTAEELRAAFKDDSRRGEYAILSQQPEIYMQASGEADGPYMLEYRDGDAQHHFQAGEEFSKEDVLRAFLWYLAGDSRWQSDFQWRKLQLKPWWRFW